MRRAITRDPVTALKLCMALFDQLDTMLLGQPNQALWDAYEAARASAVSAIDDADAVRRLQAAE